MPDATQTGPTEEESARRILSVLRELAGEPPQSLSTEAVRLRFLTNTEYQRSDFEDGAKYAIQQGWIGFTGGSKIKLLPPGQNELEGREKSGTSSAH